MTTLKNYVKDIPQLRNLNITEDDIQELFKNPDEQTINNILDQCKDMTEGDHTTIEQIQETTKLRNDDDDLSNLLIEQPKTKIISDIDSQDDPTEDQKKLKKMLMRLNNNNNIFGKPLESMTQTEFLALNIAHQVAQDIENDYEKEPLLRHYFNLSKNESALEKAMSVIPPLTADLSALKEHKNKYKIFKGIQLNTNPDLVNRLKDILTDTYRYREHLYNPNSSGGQNAFLDLSSFGSKIPTFPYNMFAIMNMNDMDKISGINDSNDD